ncbi:FadR/GntR family transcriptional regulator [Oceanibium sediminis]|uniref:FadR/GntR family transcriptional regulator n=1 Tax=Oceanibium sediminis TaxID=2026339 RepID=UPI000DD40189|nr:FCD domain-containing protein [Oceanibium sediminis]
MPSQPDDAPESPPEDGHATPPARARRAVRRRRMHEELVEVLAEDIRQGVYPVDEVLPSERQLMDDFGVSRLTVREALASLESHGLIETRPGTRARVCGPRADFLLDMLSQAATFSLRQPGGLKIFAEVRELVESGTAQLAAERATDDQIEILRDRISANRAAIGDTRLFGTTDIDFHLAIAEIVDNPIISSFFRAVDQWLQEVRDTSLRNEGQMETAHAAHVKIFEAIEARSPDRAAAEMRAHLRQLARIYPTNPDATPPRTRT